jgi:hypothetical protein
MNEVKRREEEKRQKAQDRLARWKSMQQFLAWAALQSTAPKRTPAALKAKERRLVAGLAKEYQPPEIRSHD